MCAIICSNEVHEITPLSFPANAEPLGLRIQLHINKFSELPWRIGLNHICMMSCFWMLMMMIVAVVSLSRNNLTNLTNQSFEICASQKVPQQTKSQYHILHSGKLFLDSCWIGVAGEDVVIGTSSTMAKYPEAMSAWNASTST